MLNVSLYMHIAKCVDKTFDLLVRDSLFSPNIVVVLNEDFKQIFAALQVPLLLSGHIVNKCWVTLRHCFFYVMHIK